MKYIFTIIFIRLSFCCVAQKYVLLDETMAQPPIVTNEITAVEKFKRFFPVERKDIGAFIKALEEINARILKGGHENANEFRIGCTLFTGRAFPLATGERLDYIITSNCDDIKVSMHLVDAKLTNANNAYFLKAWISYIKSFEQK